MTMLMWRVVMFKSSFLDFVVVFSVPSLALLSDTTAISTIDTVSEPQRVF